MRVTIKIITLSLIVFLTATSANAWWPIFYEPEFNGQILDIDTKEPVAGAVVVVEYIKVAMGVGAGQVSSIIGVQETLTDKNGKFRIPSYTTLVQPLFTWKGDSVFLVFKPGYANINGLALKNYFTGEEEKEAEGSWPGPEFKGLKYRLRRGIVELPKLKTREQRWHASIIGVSGYTAKDLPLFYKARDEEDKALSTR